MLGHVHSTHVHTSERCLGRSMPVVARARNCACQGTPLRCFVAGAFETSCLGFSSDMLGSAACCFLWPWDETQTDIDSLWT